MAQRKKRTNPADDGPEKGLRGKPLRRGEVKS